VASTDAIIACEQLVKVYDSPTGRVQAVRGVDFDVERGATTAIVGPSGSGKSSLLRMIAALDPPTAGSVTISGVDLNGLRAGRRARRRSHLLTHVYQRPADNLLHHLTASQQLLRIAQPKRHAGEVVTAALDDLGLGHRRHHTPPEMSGGEQQRLAFARSVVADHELVNADEPTAELDATSADAVLETIELLADRGVTVLVATHDPRVILRTSQVVMLRDGAIASVTAAGTELAVIDRSGRLQLPPNVRSRFPDRKAVLGWDEDSGRLTVDPP
jgi:putative ABC transport system ATP-binding protein